MSSAFCTFRAVPGPHGLGRALVVGVSPGSIDILIAANVRFRVRCGRWAIRTRHAVRTRTLRCLGRLLSIGFGLVSRLWRSCGHALAGAIRVPHDLQTSRPQDLRTSRPLQNLDPRIHVSERDQLFSRSASTAGSDLPCALSACCKPSNDHPLCGCCSRSSR